MSVDKLLGVFTYRWDLPAQKYYVLAQEDASYVGNVLHDQECILEKGKVSQSVFDMRAPKFTADSSGQYGKTSDLWPSTGLYFTNSLSAGWLKAPAPAATPVLLEVEIELASSTSFVTPGVTSVVLDVGGVLGAAVLSGSIHRTGQYTSKYLAMFSGYLLSFVKDKFLVKAKVTFQHSALPDDQYDSLVAHIGVRLTSGGWKIAIKDPPPIPLNPSPLLHPHNICCCCSRNGATVPVRSGVWSMGIGPVKPVDAEGFELV